MEFTFLDAVKELGPGAAFRIASAARPPSDYLFNTILPERPSNSNYVEAGEMTIRSTMAGLTAADSPYAPGGVMNIATFLERVAKITLRVPFSEMALETLQEMINRLRFESASRAKEALVQEALNFLQKVIIQGHLDRSEWMRARALLNGTLAWDYQGKQLNVVYGVPAGNLQPLQTIASGNAFHLPGSTFWDSYRAAREALRHNVRAIICHPTTWDAVIFNDANNMEITQQNGNTWTVRRLVSRLGNTQLSSDNREIITVVTYDIEGEIFNVPDTSQTTVVPFMELGKFLIIGNNRRNEYRVGEGSTDRPRNDLELGYHHMGTTTESGGQSGRWADLYVPQEEPWALVGRSASKELPVILNPDKIYVLNTEMP